MMKHWRIALLSFLLTAVAFSAAGCISNPKKVLKANEEILLYALPFDLTYLRTIEALELVPGWELEETEKEKGLIRMRNVNFSRFDDSDKQDITFIIKRVGARETSVQIAKQSMYSAGGDTLLQSVTQYLKRETEKNPVAPTI